VIAERLLGFDHSYASVQRQARRGRQAGDAAADHDEIRRCHRRLFRQRPARGQCAGFTYCISVAIQFVEPEERFVDGAARSTRQAVRLSKQASAPCGAFLSRLQRQERTGFFKPPNPERPLPRNEPRQEGTTK
jgi:hypothetical protein